MLIDSLRNAYDRLPEGFRRWVLVNRRSPIWLRSGILFIHVPKAAGTSINQALYGQFMGHVRASDVERWAPAEVKALPSFAITRNPWARLVSAYRFVRRGEGVGGAIRAAVSRPERFDLPEFDSFDRFVLDWLTMQDVSRLDSIFQPQSLFVCDRDGKALVDHVGRIEDLEPTYAFIRQTLGMMPLIQPANRSGRPIDYRDFYAAELVDAVARIYANDVYWFGYSFGD